MKRATRFLAAAVVLPLATECALLGKNDPLVPRYYSPESAEGAVGSASPTPRVVKPGLALRLGRIGGGSYLKERIVFRDAEHELGFYEDRRWTERPEVYLQRALERALFEGAGVKRVLVSGEAPTLTADLIEFEEVRGASPGVRLRISYALHDDHVVLRERTISVQRPLAALVREDSSGAVATALGEALRTVVDQITAEVLADLSVPPP
jgi:hypothetical protein